MGSGRLFVWAVNSPPYYVLTSTICNVCGQSCESKEKKEKKEKKN